MPMPRKFTFIVYFILITGVIGASTAAYYFYNQYKQASNSQLQNDKELAALKASVSKLLVLPDEEPVIATVTDKTKLEQQAFFKFAENGDKVLIFQKASKAVLYRPSVNKIVDITALNAVTSTSEDQSTADSDLVSPVTVAIYNGTTTSGMAVKLEQKLLNTVSDSSVVIKSNAARTDYLSTVVVDVTKKNTSKAIEIAESIGAKVGEIPAGEQLPQADILIIAGADQL